MSNPNLRSVDFRALGAKGGRARAAALPPEQRSSIARQAGIASRKHQQARAQAAEAEHAALQARAEAAEGRVGELLAAVRTQREHSRIGHGCDVDRDGICAVWAEADRQIAVALAAAPSVAPGSDRCTSCAASTPPADFAQEVYGAIAYAYPLMHGARIMADRAGDTRSADAWLDTIRRLTDIRDWAVRFGARTDDHTPGRALEPMADRAAAIVAAAERFVEVVTKERPHGAMHAPWEDFPWGAFCDLEDALRAVVGGEGEG